MPGGHGVPRFNEEGLPCREIVGEALEFYFPVLEKYVGVHFCAVHVTLADYFGAVGEYGIKIRRHRILYVTQGPSGFVDIVYPDHELAGGPPCGF